MPINPLDALKSLLAGSKDLNADDPHGMVQARLGQESQGEDDLRRYQNIESDPRHLAVSGASPSTFHDLSRLLSESPNFGTDADARAKATTAANDAAIQQGFGGDSEIATPLPNDLQDHPTHPQMYANVNRSDLSPSQRLGHAQLLAAAYKEDAPVRAAVAGKLAEGQAIRETNRYNFDMQRQGAAGAPPAQATPPPAAPAAAAPGAPPAAPQSPFQHVKDFLLGHGDKPYNGLSDYLGAKAERGLSDIAATPETSVIQRNLLGNAQELAGIFPSSRAAGVLAKIAQEFQANYGHETPQNSYQRIKNQIADLGDAEHEFDDPSLNTKFDAQGRMQITNSNQTIQRAKIAVGTSRNSLMKALAEIERLHPGIGGAPATQAAPSRFQRLPE